MQKGPNLMDLFLPGTGDKWKQNETFHFSLDHCWFFFPLQGLTDDHGSVWKITRATKNIPFPKLQIVGLPIKKGPLQILCDQIKTGILLVITGPASSLGYQNVRFIWLFDSGVGGIGFKTNNWRFCLCTNLCLIFLALTYYY